MLEILYPNSPQSALELQNDGLMLQQSRRTITARAFCPGLLVTVGSRARPVCPSSSASWWKLTVGKRQHDGDFRDTAWLSRVTGPGAAPWGLCSCPQ